MDPVTLLMSGLTVVGATIGDKAIKDGYDGLKALLARKFGASAPTLTARVDDFVADPDTFAKPMEKALRESGAAQDPEIVGQVTTLVEKAEAVTPGASALIGQLKAIRSSVAVVAGDVHGGITFSAPPSSSKSDRA